MRCKEILIAGITATMLLAGCGKALDSADSKRLGDSKEIASTTETGGQEESKKAFFWSSKEEVEGLTEDEVLDLKNYYSTDYYFDSGELYSVNLFGMPLEEILFADDDTTGKQAFDNLGEFIMVVEYDGFDETASDIDFNKVIDNDTLYKFVEEIRDEELDIEDTYRESDGTGSRIDNYVYEICGEDEYYVSTRLMMDISRYFEANGDGNKIRMGTRYLCFNNLVRNYKYDMFFLGELNENTVRDTFDLYYIQRFEWLQPMIYRCVEDDTNSIIYTAYALRKEKPQKKGDCKKVVIDRHVVNIDKASRKVTIEETESLLSAGIPGTTLEKNIVQ